jgi:hypothetical protein
MLAKEGNMPDVLCLYRGAFLPYLGLSEVVVAVWGTDRRIKSDMFVLIYDEAVKQGEFFDMGMDADYPEDTKPPSFQSFAQDQVHRARNFLSVKQLGKVKAADDFNAFVYRPQLEASDDLNPLRTLWSQRLLRDEIVKIQKAVRYPELKAFCNSVMRSL